MKLPAPLSTADFGRVQTIFTDVDGTLTTGGILESSTIRALELLRESGLRVVLVSGRPAGWGEAWARQLPVDGVIVENGGMYFARESDGEVRKVFLQRTTDRKKNAPRLLREVRKAMRQVPGARPLSVMGPMLIRVSASTGKPTAVHMRRTWRLRPSWIVTSMIVALLRSS